MDKIKVAIIGCGMIAESHAKALLSDPRAQLVAAAYGTNKARGDAFGERFGVPKIVGDYRELLNDKLDMVCICTPSGLHAACAIDFAHAGVNVLCEKPLDIKSGAMTDMITAASDAGVKLGCVFSNRTRPGIKRAKELLQAGELGDMRIVECQYRGYRSPAYYTSSKWKGTRAMDGGGCLINQGIHAIDLMMYLCGDVSSVCAQVGALGRDIEVEDTAAALLAFQNGAQGVIMGTTLSHIPENAPEGDRIRIECARGSILYAEGKTTYYKNEKSDDFDVTPIALDDVINVVNSGSTPENIDMVGHSEIVSNFISAILDEAEVMISAESARRGVDLVLAIYRSADAHGWVDVVYN